MASDWEEVNLGDLFEQSNQGVNTTTEKVEYSDDGLIVIRAKNISAYSIDYQDVVHVSEETFDKLKSAVKPKCGDILFTNIGSQLGSAALVKNNSNFIIAWNVFRIVPNLCKVNAKFLESFLNSEETGNLVRGLNASSTMPFISGKVLRGIKLNLPPLPEQKAIAHILGSLDDKIELNRQMNETLEAMAQALFKSWFVDFDPVIGNALAAGNSIPDEFAERAEQRKGIEKKDNADIQGLFPDEFEFTEEMGWIPKGWVITNLKDHAEKISKGTTPSKAILAKADDDSTIPFLKVRDLDDEGKIDTQNLDLIPKSIHENALKRSILQTGDLLFSIAGTIGRVSIVPKELDNSNSNQALAFIRPKDDIKTYFLLQFLKSQEVQDEISSRVVQAVQANVSLTELGSLKFATASDDLFRKWHSIVQSWIDKINLLQMENSHLSKLRDTLLPKLMSGELRIADAAALVDKTI